MKSLLIDGQCCYSYRPKLADQSLVKRYDVHEAIAIGSDYRSSGDRHIDGLDIVKLYLVENSEAYLSCDRNKLAGVLVLNCQLNLLSLILGELTAVSQIVQLNCDLWHLHCCDAISRSLGRNLL